MNDPESVTETNSDKSRSRGISCDMSAQAVLRRLEIVDELTELAKDLQTAKRLGLVETIDSQTTTGKQQAVDMSGEAISRRIRQVSELDQLGLSLLKAKPCPAPTVVIDEKGLQKNFIDASDKTESVCINSGTAQPNTVSETDRKKTTDEV